MTDLLLAVVVLGLVVAGVAAAAGIGFVHALSVHNRVVRGHPSPAPLAWLVTPGLAARLHRRLRMAMAMAGAVTGPTADDLGLVDVVRQLRDRALELDERAVIAGRAPRGRRRTILREVQADVGELEALVERTVRMSRAWTGSAPAAGELSAVRERLELLESALADLAAFDVTRGDAPGPVDAHRSRQA